MEYRTHTQCFASKRATGSASLVPAEGIDMYPVGFFGYKMFQKQGCGDATSVGSFAHIIQISNLAGQQFLVGLVKRQNP